MGPIPTPATILARKGSKRRSKAWKSKQARENYAYIKELKSNTPCHDCHLLYLPCVMDFDHVRGKKLGNVSQAAQTWTLDRVKLEIAKCEVVCSNCHRVRTHVTRKR